MGIGPLLLRVIWSFRHVGQLHACLTHLKPETLNYPEPINSYSRSQKVGTSLSSCPEGKVYGILALILLKLCSNLLASILTP